MATPQQALEKAMMTGLVIRWKGAGTIQHPDNRSEFYPADGIWQRKFTRKNRRDHRATAFAIAMPWTSAIIPC
jgi:hypothetical protein